MIQLNPDQVVEDFRRKTRRSHELYIRAKKLMPLGVSASIRHMEPYPLYFTEGRGAMVYDADGNEYIDLCCAYGALFIGHSNEVLVEAIKRRISEGVLFGGEWEDSYEVSRILASTWNLDMVRFSSTGLEAVLHSLRISRAYTAREKVIKFQGCYHGGVDQLLVSVSPPSGMLGSRRTPLAVRESPGIPSDLQRNTLVALYNDLNSVEEILRRHENQVAAIIVEPVALNMGVVPPKKGFLEGLRKLSDEYGVVLIFDEIKTAGRIAKGGAAEKFGVKPDIAIVGKAIGGGLPFSAIIGREEIMKVIEQRRVAHSGTFSGNPLSLTAARVVMEKILTQDAYSHVYRLSEEISNALSDILSDGGIKGVVQHIGPSGHFYPGVENAVENYRNACLQDSVKWRTYWTYMAVKGVLIEPSTPLDCWTVPIPMESSSYIIEQLKELPQLLKD
jgi:glutamate-1-semialdehyde 2,1-aminomutase